MQRIYIPPFRPRFIITFGNTGIFFQSPSRYVPRIHRSAYRSRTSVTSFSTRRLRSIQTPHLHLKSCLLAFDCGSLHRATTYKQWRTPRAARLDYPASGCVHISTQTVWTERLPLRYGAVLARSPDFSTVYLPKQGCFHIKLRRLSSVQVEPRGTNTNGLF